MQQWVFRLKSGWNGLKVLRVALGFVILVGGIQAKDTMNILFGTFFLGLALFTDGVCCGGGSCYVPPSKLNTDKIENEELDSKK